MLSLTPSPCRAQGLSLRDALALAAEHRSELRQGDIDLLRARLALLRAQLEHVHLTVQASLSEQAQMLDVNAPSSFFQYNCAVSDVCRKEAHSFNVTANLTVPIFSGLLVESDIARARALERAATQQRKATWLAIAVGVVDGYWAVRRASLEHEGGVRALQREEDIEASTKARVDAGISPAVDYQRAHLQVLRQQGQIRSLAELRDQAVAALAALLQVDDTLVPNELPPESAPPVPPLEEVERQAMTSRPELAIAAAQLEAKAQSVRAAKSQYWPQLSIVGSAQAGNQAFWLPQFTADPAPSAVARSEAFVANLFIGAQLNWTIFDMMTTTLNVRDAGFARDRAHEDQVRARYLVLADVRSAWQRLRHEVERLAIVTSSAKVAEDAIEGLRKRYRVGSAAIYEVTAAEDELITVELDLLSTRIAIAQAQAELCAAMGQL